MKRKNALDLLAAARPADLDLPGSPQTMEELPTPVRRGRARWVGAVAASLATASVIGALALPRLLDPGVSTGHMATHSAGNALDTAARNAAAQRQTPGRFWHTEGLILGEEVIGAPDNRYRIKTRVQTGRWVPRDPATRTVFTERGLPTVPASGQEEQAWRRAGKPKLCGNDTDCKNDTAPLGRTRFMFMPGTWPYGDQGLTLPAAELLDLPQEPDALRERLLAFWPAYSESMKDWPSPPPGSSLPTKDSWLRGISLDLLQHAPISAGTRGALYRMVANLPGTRALGQIADAEGRLGIGIGWTQAVGDGQSEQQLIVEESSGRLLALQSVVVKPWSRDPAGSEGAAGLPAGTVYDALVYQRAAWTNTPARLPEGCSGAVQTDRMECVG
ncbi:CU044_5270 family protein [Nonomuraea guangzhouensis]|uniref:CU044_5270 family protein n=1 Tax=Nonomuraea guangzhouensis TaxID=1291555 RepID=A0ABW4GDV0_9ACTN|nr:CU044_5270 family protein [Nonomuraea guangzhouensis]